VEEGVLAVDTAWVALSCGNILTKNHDNLEARFKGNYEKQVTGTSGGSSNTIVSLKSSAVVGETLKKKIINNIQNNFAKRFYKNELSPCVGAAHSMASFKAALSLSCTKLSHKIQKYN
jgi:hypothetical protein